MIDQPEVNSTICNDQLLLQPQFIP